MVPSSVTVDVQAWDIKTLSPRGNSSYLELEIEVAAFSNFWCCSLPSCLDVEIPGFLVVTRNS